MLLIVSPLVFFCCLQPTYTPQPQSTSVFLPELDGLWLLIVLVLLVLLILPLPVFISAVVLYCGSLEVKRRSR